MRDARTGQGVRRETKGRWGKFNPEAEPAGEDNSGHNYLLEGPMLVRVSVSVYDIGEVDLVNETFRPNFTVVLDWVDDGIVCDNRQAMPGYMRRGLAGGGFAIKEAFADAEQGAAGVWTPGLFIANPAEEVTPTESWLSVKLQNRRPARIGSAHALRADLPVLCPMPCACSTLAVRSAGSGRW